MNNRLSKFAELAPWQKLTVAQAWLLLGWYRLGIILLSFKRVTAHLQHHPLPQSLPPLQPGQCDEAMMIGRLVAAAARLTPWQSRCLAQVLVTQRLLAKRNIPGQFYLGVQRGGEFAGDCSEFSAHAWLQCGDAIVTGIVGHDRFTVVSSFRWGMPVD